MTKACTSVLAGLFLACLVPGAVLAAPPGKAVPTETIIAPSDKAGDSPPAYAMPEIPSERGDEAPPGGGLATPTPPDQGTTPDATAIPTVEYDVDKLPSPVRRLREQIIEAAATGDIDRLRPIIDANGEPPALSLNDVDDPIEFMHSESGDEGGREILAILLDVLNAGYVHVDAGTPDEMYVWPYFAEYPLDKLTPPQLVELFRIVYAGDYEDMKQEGGYNFYKVGIAPNGVWKSFLAGN